MADSKDYITIGAGNKVKVHSIQCDITKLTYYEKNPRILSIISSFEGKITQNFIEEELWKKDYTKQLYRQIEKDGGLVEPLLVYKNVVLEGNTRLCCCKQLFKKTKEKHWQYASCRVIDDEIKQEQIDFLLCTYHIKRKKDWDPYEQACYFKKMKDEDNIPMEKIQELTGMSAPTIYQYLRALKNMNQHDERDPKRFSHWFEFVKNVEIQKQVKNDPNLVEKFHASVKAGNISRAIDVRKVGDILKDKRIAKDFFEGKIDITEAEVKIRQRRPEVADIFLKELSEITDKLKDISNEKLRNIKSDKRKLRILRDFAISARKIFKFLDI